MRFIKYLIVVFLFNQFLFAQFSGRPQRQFQREHFLDDQIFYSYWLNPVQYEDNFVLNYHIRYDFLLFEKLPSEKSFADTFQAKIKVMLELTSKSNLSPIRNIEEVTIKSTDFNQTISKNIFYTSNFSLKIPEKTYKAQLTIIDQIRNKEFQLPPFEVNLEDTFNFSPIFIKESNLNEIFSTDIKNKFLNFLPFSPEGYVLVLPDKKDFDTIKIVNKYVNYTLVRKESVGLRYSIFSLDTLDLIEGSYTIKYGKDFKNSKQFFVKWLDKPEYLKNLDNAIKIMSYLFEDDKSLNKYFVDKDDLLHKFYEIWKKFDPTPSTAFNELMAEFYRRADFASLEFKSVSQPDGALTDRGKIYLIYGPPASIDRTFSKDGRGIEIWKYNAGKQLTFTFFDENKNGNYILQQ